MDKIYYIGIDEIEDYNGGTEMLGPYTKVEATELLKGEFAGRCTRVFKIVPVKSVLTILD